MSVQEGIIQVDRVLEGRYRIVSEGIRQDIGTLYRAHDVQQNRFVEVLLVARRFGSGTAALERMKQANQALANLRQPVLIPFEHAGLVDGQLYLVRRQAAGRPLAEILVRDGPLDVKVVVQIAIRLCEALAPLHRAGLVHGGLSPHSILISDDDQEAGESPGPISGPDLGRSVAVIDAGLLPALRPVPAPPGRPWGRTPHFSPEQAAGEKVHPASDVYVIGSLLYEMLTGRPPFRASEETVLALQHLRQDPPSLRILVPRIPLPLEQIIQKALAKEPAARYRNAGQLAHILRSQVGPRPISQTPQPAAPRHSPAKERLVVPAPPVPVQVIRDAGPEIDGWAEESDGVDWLLIGLIIAASIAVLGLIPLWRTVRRRYAAPPPVPAPASYHLPWEETPLVLVYPGEWEGEAKGRVELDGFGLVWYNVGAPRALASIVLYFPADLTYKGLSADGLGAGQSVRLDELADLGVQLTGFTGKL